MLSRKSAGTILFLTFLMLCGVAGAHQDGGLRGGEEGLAGTNFNLALSPASPICCGLTNGVSNSWSQAPTLPLSILAHGMGVYALHAIVIGTGTAGFTEATLPSTTTDEEDFGNPVSPSLVPEPSTSVFLITGLLLTAGMRWRPAERARSMMLRGSRGTRTKSVRD